MSTSTESKSADKLLLRLVTVSEKLKTSLNHIHGDLLKEIKKLRTQLAKAKENDLLWKAAERLPGLKTAQVALLENENLKVLNASLEEKNERLRRELESKEQTNKDLRQQLKDVLEPLLKTSLEEKNKIIRLRRELQSKEQTNKDLRQQLKDVLEPLLKTKTTEGKVEEKVEDTKDESPSSESDSDDDSAYDTATGGAFRNENLRGVKGKLIRMLLRM